MARRNWFSTIAVALAMTCGSAASVQADNTLYFYDVFGRLIGQSSDASTVSGYAYDKAGNRTQFWNTPSNTPTQQSWLLSGQVMLQGQQIVSSDGRYTFVYQYDGNVVLYDRGSPIWSMGTAGVQSSFLAMQTDGNLVLYSPQFVAIWSSNTSASANANASLTVQTDGNLVIYKPNGPPIWATYTTGQ